jgi:isoquinoline 1-oxidoreductase beta subunit
VTTQKAAEVSVDTNAGDVKVHHPWAAVDPGKAVRPEHVVARVTGAIAFGLGAALKEQMEIACAIC